MPSDPLLLAFDTSAAHCAAALLSGDRLLETRLDIRAKGQAEHLVPMLDDLLSDHGVAWRNLTRIGVGIGPGNFTGIRISVATARGLALGLGIPAIGVSTLDALRALHPGHPVAVPAPRDMIYLQTDGMEPALVPAETAPDALLPDDMDAVIAAMARCAAAADADTAGRPKPLYIKPADAAPSRDLPPRLLT